MKFFVFEVFDGEIKLTGVGNGSASDVFGKNGSVVSDGLREFSGDRVKHVTDFFLGALQSGISDDLKEDSTDYFGLGQVGNETLFKAEALSDFNELVVGLFWHLDIQEIIGIIKILNFEIFTLYPNSFRIFLH